MTSPTSSLRIRSSSLRSQCSSCSTRSLGIALCMGSARGCRSPTLGYAPAIPAVDEPFGAVRYAANVLCVLFYGCGLLLHEGDTGLVPFWSDTVPLVARVILQMWMAWPFALYILETVYGVFRARLWDTHVLGASILDPGVLTLELSKPPGFTYRRAALMPLCHASPSFMALLDLFP